MNEVPIGYAMAYACMMKLSKTEGTRFSMFMNSNPVSHQLRELIWDRFEGLQHGSRNRLVIV